MAQDLPASVDTQIAADQSKPVLLFELYLNAGTLRYAATNENIIFPTGGNTYSAKAVILSNIKTSAETQIIRASCQFDNIANDMHTYNAAEAFDGKQIIVKKVYRDALGSSSYYREIFNGYMEEPSNIDKIWMNIPIIGGSPLQRKTLQKYFQKECNHIFGDSECNRDGYADLTSLKATGTADSGTATTLTDDALTQADDYWAFGKAYITTGGRTYMRRIDSFDAGTDTLTLDVGLPVSISVGSAYTIYKGCPNTWDACQANGAYGPSSDNKANFLGFLHIGQKYGSLWERWM